MKLSPGLYERIKTAHRWGRSRPGVYYTLPVMVWAVAIAVGCLAPSDRLPELVTSVSDKLLHAGIYAVLGALLLRAWVRGGRPTPRTASAVLLIVAGYGFYIECLQGLTPSRQFDWLDQALNVTGGVAGVSLWWLLAALYGAAVLAARRAVTKENLPS